MISFWIKFFLLFVVTTSNFYFIYAKKTTALCYMVAWASTRDHQGKFNIRDADTQHCTHIVYAFMGLNPVTSEIQSIDRHLDLAEDGQGKDQLNALKSIKEINPNVKVLASIGGYNEGSVKFSEMASTSSKKTAFINSVVKFMRKYELDGFDICWQFPGQRGGRSSDKRAFISLLRDLKAVFQEEGWLLTVHVIAKRYVIDLGYDVKTISEIADFINLAAVEYHGPWDRSTGIMAPLKSKNENNVMYMVDYVLKKGAIPSKILLGLPTYGHAYITSEPVKRGQYLGLFSDQAFASPRTNEAGIIAYNEICYELKSDEGWSKEWDAESSTPVAYNDNRYVSYDNKTSLIEKAKLVKSRKLGGIMLWSLDMDDFLGLCHDQRYPMLSALTEFLDKDDEEPCNSCGNSSRHSGKPAVVENQEYGK